MGLLAPVAEFILAEHRHRTINGSTLFVGRQTTFLNEHSLASLLKRYQVTPTYRGAVEFDTATRGARGGHYITDRYFMKMLGVEDLRFVDVSDYEGADIVADLGYPVDDSLHERFDFIYNGGCLDNMFNPATAIINMSRMLRPGGRVVCLESASSYNSPYLMYSPGWFFDYYVTNGFSDCKVYVCSYRDLRTLFFGPWDLFYYDWQFNKNGPSPEAIHSNHLLIITIAEKAADSTADRQPIQYQYRNDTQLNAAFESNVLKLAQSKRPLINADVASNPFAAPAMFYRITDKLGLTQIYRITDKLGLTQRYLRPLGKFGLGLSMKN